MTSADTLTRNEHESILSEAVAPLEDKIEHQRYVIEKLQHQLYGRKSEKGVVTESGEYQTDIFEEDLPEAVQEEKQAVQAHRRRKPRKPRYPEGTKRRVVDVELEEADRTCSDCGEVMKDIGYEPSERLHVIPAQVEVEETRRHKYACSCKKGGVRIAPVKSSAFPKTQITDETRAHFLVQKFVDHLPYYRQSKILGRSGVDVPDCSLCRYGLESSDVLVPIVIAMKYEILSSSYLQADETTLPVLKTRSESPGAHRGYVWAYGVPRGTVVFEYQYGRGAKYPNAFLSAFEGVLQTDRYKGYDELHSRECIIDVACWAHARRKFAEAQKYSKKRTKPILLAIKKLYGVEKEAREAMLAPEDRARLRKIKSLPVLEHLKKLIAHESIRARPTTPLGEALQYARNAWEALVRYIDHGAVEIDNNLLENAIRPIALGRKNYLFAGSEGGAEAAANVYSITETCRRLGIDPYAYLCDVFANLVNLPAPEEYLRMTPARWKQDRESDPVVP